MQRWMERCELLFYNQKTSGLLSAFFIYYSVVETSMLYSTKLYFRLQNSTIDVTAIGKLYLIIYQYEFGTFLISRFSVGLTLHWSDLQVKSFSFGEFGRWKWKESFSKLIIDPPFFPPKKEFHSLSERSRRGEKRILPMCALCTQICVFIRTHFGWPGLSNVAT